MNLSSTTRRHAPHVHLPRPGATWHFPSLRTGVRVLVWTAGIVVALLLIVRFAFTPLATRFVNHRLVAMEHFTGHVDAVKLAVWRGTIIAENLRLSDRQHPEDGDIVIVPHADWSLAWAPVFRGRLGGQILIDRAQVVMVKRAETKKDEAQKAKKLTKPVTRAWEGVLAKQFPIEYSKIEVKDSAVRFEDRTDPQVVSVSLDRIHLIIEGFSNREKSRDALPASISLEGRLGASGKVNVEARVNPAERQPTFNAELEIKGLSLPKMHDFLVHYALADVSSGEFDLYTEVKAQHGAYDGYTKPFFKDLKFKSVPDPEKSLLQRAATKLVAATENLLKNRRGQVATKAPFHGNFEDNKVEVWTTIENLLRNAFVQALREGLEGPMPGGRY
ncbi:MAG TPA: DUF748 domain-containing protein [Lacunisphaera sp.]|jgi:hypothetical protein|nr:DUF748 domain-containing protein [Lacunisphaera sp.]